MSDKALKQDNGKVRMGLLPPDVLRSVAEVFTRGAAKYAAWNWCNGFEWSRLIDAAHRHLNAFESGEDNDPEWDLPHLAHAICCLMMLLGHQLRGLGKDDRHHILPRVLSPLEVQRTIKEMYHDTLERRAPVTSEKVDLVDESSAVTAVGAKLPSCYDPPPSSRRPRDDED